MLIHFTGLKTFSARQCVTTVRNESTQSPTLNGQDQQLTLSVSISTMKSSLAEDETKKGLTSQSTHCRSFWGQYFYRSEAQASSVKALKEGG